VWRGEGKGSRSRGVRKCAQGGQKGARERGLGRECGGGQGKGVEAEWGKKKQPGGCQKSACR
jgi:hypothetical protein